MNIPSNLFTQFTKYGFIRKPKQSYGFKSDDLDNFLSLPLEPLYQEAENSLNKAFGHFRKLDKFTAPIDKSWFTIMIILVFLALNGNSKSAKLLNEYNIDDKMLNFIRQYISSTEQFSKKGLLLPKYLPLVMTYSMMFGLGPLFSYDAIIIGSLCNDKILEEISNFYMRYSDLEAKGLGKIFAEFSKYVKKRFP